MDRKELLTKIVGLNNSAHNILFIVKDMVVREVKEILNERGQFFEFSSSFFPQVVSGGDTICYVHRIFGMMKPKLSMWLRLLTIWSGIKMWSANGMKLTLTDK